MIKFLKKIFLVGIISLGIINFSSAGSYTYTGSYSVSRTIGTTVSNINFGVIPVPLSKVDPTTIVYSGFSSISCDISNFSTDFDFQNLSSRLQGGYALYPDVYSTSLTRTKLGFSSFTYTNLNPDFYTTNKGFPLYFILGYKFDNFSSQVSGQISFDWSCTISGDIIMDQSSSICDYSDYELKSDITESYCTNKYSSLMTGGQCNILYSGYVSPELYGICTNSLNNSSSELATCTSTLNSCLNGNYSGVQRSSLFVNGIQHLGASIIDITIPEEISWDYTNENDEFDLVVSGYNVDPEYIEDILEVQTFHPSSEDFTQSFTGTLVLLLPYIIIVLFIMFIWKLLRGIFK